MSRFSHCFTDFVTSTYAGSQTEAAKAIGVSKNTIGRWMYGDVTPDQPGMEILCRSVPPKNAARLLVSWLKDLCPPHQLQSVEITLRETACKETEPLPSVFAELDPKTQWALSTIARACVQHPAARDAVHSTASLLVSK